MGELVLYPSSGGAKLGGPNQNRERWKARAENAIAECLTKTAAQIPTDMKKTQKRGQEEAVIISDQGQDKKRPKRTHTPSTGWKPIFPDDGNLQVDGNGIIRIKQCGPDQARSSKEDSQPQPGDKVATGSEAAGASCQGLEGKGTASKDAHSDGEADQKNHFPKPAS